MGGCYCLLYETFILEIQRIIGDHLELHIGGGRQLASIAEHIAGALYTSL
jgi:hypothetical protein